MRNKILPLTAVCLLLSIGTGVALPMLLTHFNVSVEPNGTVGAAYATVLGLLFIIFIVEIVSAFKIDDSTFHTVCLAGSVFVQFLFSADTQLFLESFGLKMPDIALGISGEISFVLCETSCLWYICYLYNLRWDRGIYAAIAIPVILLVLADSLLFLWGWGHWAHFLIAAIFTVMLFAALVRASKKSEIGFTTYFVAAVFCLSAGAQSVNALCFNDVANAYPGITFVYAVLSVSMFISVYLAFSVHADLKAVQSEEYKSQVRSFKLRAFTGQIKPHFIFNALEAIKSFYHRDVASGDTAVSLLSDLLNDSINAFDHDLVPFEKELDTIYSYTEFENMKRQRKAEVIFNTEFTDFSVPPFSVEPFVENAMRYSGVEDKEGGRIVISSFKRGGTVVIEVFDNGRGFDPAAVKETSHGIRNASERFQIAFAATPRVESVPGEGTRITIEIPAGDEEDHA